LFFKENKNDYFCFACKTIGMNKEIFKRIIVDNHEFISTIKLVPRSLVIEPNANIVFTGARRAGKTFAMFEIIHNFIGEALTWGEVLYINFEDERLIELKVPDLAIIIEAHHELFNCKPIIFFDEIQVVEGWEKFVRRLADNKYRLYITGSNAQMLSKEISTTLGGRFITNDVFPLSFSEFLKMQQVELQQNWQYSSERFKVRQAFDTWFYYGGFPEINLFNNKKLWLQNLYQKIFFGDIILRYNIRNDFALKILVKKLAESLHDETSFTRIKNIIQSTGVKLGTATVIEYINHLVDSWLVFKVENYLAKTGEREKAGKYYFIDNGIVSLFLMSPESILLENIVALQLHRKYNKDFYYLKKLHEVDFYLPNEKTMIQVCYKMEGINTEEREIKSMLSLMKYVEAEKLLIITLDEERIVHVNDVYVQVLPVWKWILEL
jgi:uncharacterized protein